MWLQIIVLHIEKKGKIATNCCNAVNFFQCKLGQHWGFNQRFQGKSFPFWYFQSVYASYANLKISNMDAFVAPFSLVLLSTEKIWNARKAGIFRVKFEDPETFWILLEICFRKSQEDFERFVHTLKVPKIPGWNTETHRTQQILIWIISDSHWCCQDIKHVAHNAKTFLHSVNGQTFPSKRLGAHNWPTWS